MQELEDKVVWATTDFRGNYVEFRQTTQQHILKYHPEVADYIDDMKYIVEQPHMVIQSLKFEDTLIHCKYGYVSAGTANQWFHVPVSYQVGGIGRVASAYIIPYVKPGKPIYVNIKL